MTETPDQVMRRVTEEMIRRAVGLSKKMRRTVFISKSAKGEGMDVKSLDPGTVEGRKNLDVFLSSINRSYTIYGLGAPEDKDSINWRKIAAPAWKRAMLLLQVALSLVMKGTPLKNSLFRWMGCHIGRNVEIMQMAWLDHFRPDLIFMEIIPSSEPIPTLPFTATKDRAGSAMAWSKSAANAQSGRGPGSAPSGSGTTCAPFPGRLSPPISPGSNPDP
jgi:hypothetical protein